MREGGGLFPGRDREMQQREADRQEAFEESTVKRILHIAGAKFNLSEARKEASRFSQVHSLSFDWFHDAYPRFPVRMGSAKIANMHHIAVADLFGSHLRRTPFFKEYLHFLTSQNIDDVVDRVGFVFNWPDIGAMVLHNFPVTQVGDISDEPDSRESRGTRIVRPFGNPLVIYVIERLSDFVQNIGNDWTDV